MADVAIAAHYRSLSEAEIASELEQMALDPEDPELADRRKFLQGSGATRREIAYRRLRGCLKIKSE